MKDLFCNLRIFLAIRAEKIFPRKDEASSISILLNINCPGSILNPQGLWSLDWTLVYGLWTLADSGFPTGLLTIAQTLV